MSSINTPNTTNTATVDDVPKKDRLQIFRSIDLGSWKPPAILLYQESPQARMQRYPFDPRLVECSALEARNNGGRVSIPKYPLSINDQTVYVPIRLQTPRSTTIFGCSRFKSQDGSVSVTVDYAFNASLCTESPDLWDFYRTMWMLDNHYIATAQKNKTKWFPNKRSMSDASIEELYNRMTQTRWSKDGTSEYAPSLRCRIPYRSNRPLTTVYDHNAQETTVDGIMKGCGIRMIFTQPWLWFRSSEFSVTNNAEQIQVFPPAVQALPTSYSFVGDDESMSGAVDATSPAAGQGMVDAAVAEGFN
jgi:hypothetical protein